MSFTLSRSSQEMVVRDFAEFADAKAFAKAAEKSVSITRVGITNNESPQYLTLWDKS